ncbi:MAG: ATP-binding protein, partial [Deltaproteobacteria bacterium]|nr:ATP-binding protein [Deltaproteobacteria bacterium]
PVPLDVLAELSRTPGAERATRVTATLFGGREVLQLRAGERTGLYGIALDLGTTSLVCFLCDLAADKIVAVRSAANPQTAYGEDVISRVAAVQRDASRLGELQRLLVGAINVLVADVAAQAQVDADDLVDVVAVGNPIMQHLLLGLNPLSLGQAPYLPLCRHGGEVSAASLGLAVYPGARVHLLPMLSGFIGADTLAALVTRPPDFFRGTNLLVDVGTNGELVLSRDGVLTATSCATGPVFEGAHIRSGMRASPGAIEAVKVGEGGRLELSVIPNADGSRAKPAGLCGSGVISAVSALVDAGILRPDGAFDLEGGHPGLRAEPDGSAAYFVLAPAARSHTGRDVVLGQWDVRAVQLGKAALRAGVEILCREAGVERLDGIYLAGTFGNYLNPVDLLRIGVLPPVEAEQIVAIGNAAGDGARLALFSTAYRKRAAALAERIRVVELSMRADFQDVFVDSMELGACAST